MKNTRLVALLAVVGVVATGGHWVARRLSAAKKLSAQATPFHAAPAQPDRRILVIGDSTAVGTGANHPEESVAGRIAAAHPTWLIHNHAKNGAKFADLVAQLQGAQIRYDLVLVMAGGNDVMRLTPAGALSAHVTSVVRLAQTRAPIVALLPSGNVGHAPFFFPPLSWLMSSRSKTLHAIIRKIAMESGARYVRLLESLKDDPFALEPRRMHAADGLHPSSDGYAQWFTELERQGGLAPSTVI